MRDQQIITKQGSNIITQEIVAHRIGPSFWRIKRNTFCTHKFKISVGDLKEHEIEHLAKLHYVIPNNKKPYQYGRQMI